MRSIPLALLVATMTALPLARAAAAASAPDPQALLTRYKCYTCHDDHEPKAGPAYADVAAHYRKTPDAASLVALEIRRGIRSGGPWHMPPHPEVSAADAKTMARYILSRQR